MIDCKWCKYALEWYHWSLRLAAFSARCARDLGFFSNNQGCGSGYYFASRVFKNNNFWLASNVSLVESESGVPLTISRWTWYQQVFFKCRTIFFFFHSRTPHVGDPARCRRTLSPAYKTLVRKGWPNTEPLVFGSDLCVLSSCLTSDLNKSVYVAAFTSLQPISEGLEDIPSMFLFNFNRLCY